MLIEMTALPEKLRELRAARMVTQIELSEMSSVSEAGIRNLETGRASHPRRATIEKLADALAVDARDLANPALTTREVLRRAERREQGGEDE